MHTLNPDTTYQLLMPAFRFRHSLAARFRDCDLFGHVNNSVYFTYMEEARWAYWRELTGDFPHSRLPGLILARAECDFIRPVQPGERIDIWLGATKIGRTSVSIDCEMLDEPRRGGGERAGRHGDVRLRGRRTRSRARLGPHAHRGVRGTAIVPAHDSSRASLQTF